MGSRSVLQQVHLCCTDLASCKRRVAALLYVWWGLMSKLALHQRKEEVSPLTLMKLLQSVKVGQERAESGYVDMLEICNRRATYQHNRQKQRVREEILVSICPRITKKATVI